MDPELTPERLEQILDLLGERQAQIRAAIRQTLVHILLSRHIDQDVKDEASRLMIRLSEDVQ
jgi:hypothetical protein